MPGEMICSLLEAPSCNAVALEESYWAFGDKDMYIYIYMYICIYTYMYNT